MRQVRRPILLAATLALAFAACAETSAERLMRATFKIFNTDSTSTGFLVCDPAAGGSRTNVLLVSAAHTFKKAKGDSVLLVCRVKEPDGAWKRLDHKIMIRDGTNALWTSHSTQDVAVIRCALPPQADFAPLPMSSLATERDAQSLGLTVGSHIFYFGYPYRTEANAAGFPILREGVVSGYPLFPAAQYPHYFMSAPTFSGDSGAPVSVAEADDAQPHIIGLVITRTQQKDKLTSADFEMTFKRDMALGSIVQAEFIRETIDLLR